MNRLLLRTSLVLALAAAAAASGPVAASAGTAGRVKVPRHGLVFKIGVYVPSASSDLWNFNADVLTTSAGDYTDLRLGIEYDYTLANRLELSAELAFYEGLDNSVYRSDPLGRTVPQSTRFALNPLTVGLRWLPGGRFRRSGGGPLNRPRQVVPYLGAGFGFYFWEFEMAGQFVDADTDEIFNDVFYADGTALGYHAAAGIEIAVGPAWGIQLEARYQWAQDGLGGSFIGFDDLDLGGWAGSVGFALRFP